MSTSIIEEYDAKDALDWYRNVPVTKRIFLKENFKKLCGVEFSELNFMFSLKERITILHTKLLIDGLI